MGEFVHAVPTYGKEHVGDMDCWCAPLIDYDNGIVIHRCPKCNEIARCSCTPNERREAIVERQIERGIY